MTDLVHMGGYVNVNGSNRKEVQVRMRAGASRWCNLGQYWFAPGPWRSRRSAFLADVAGRIWSGLEAYALAPLEIQGLDTSTAKKLGAMLHGRACTECEDSARTSWITKR
eukprot:865439-Pyramimonas_sp.AAC.1